MVGILSRPTNLKEHIHQEKLSLESLKINIKSCRWDHINSSPLDENGCHFAYDTFKRILIDKKFLISIQISVTFVSMGPIDDQAALVQVIARVNNKNWGFNSSPSRHNGRCFADDIFRCIFVNDVFCILIRISLKFVPKDLIDNKPAFVQIMTWRRIGHYRNQCWTNSLTHICGTRGRWVKAPLLYRVMHVIIWHHFKRKHYNDVMMSAMASQNHQPHDCLLNCLFRLRSKETAKLSVTGICAWNSPVIGEFPAQKASNAENVSIWWRHHALR